MPRQNRESLPLIENGFRQITLAELRRLCVERFPASTTREEIYKEFSGILNQIEEVGLKGTLWINGGFLTESFNPNDVDFVLWLDHEFADCQTEEQERILSCLQDHHGLYDSYVEFEFAPDDPRCERFSWKRNYWSMQFGRTRKSTPKGIATMRIGGGK